MVAIGAGMFVVPLLGVAPKKMAVSCCAGRRDRVGVVAAGGRCGGCGNVGGNGRAAVRRGRHQNLIQHPHG